jgi:hypothetical protein
LHNYFAAISQRSRSDPKVISAFCCFLAAFCLSIFCFLLFVLNFPLSPLHALLFPFYPCQVSVRGIDAGPIMPRSARSPIAICSCGWDKAVQFHPFADAMRDSDEVRCGVV